MFSTSIHSHGFDESFYGVFIGTHTKYNLGTKDFLSGVNINSYLLLVNISLEQPSLICGDDNTFRCHIGVGLLSIVQLQYGFNYSLRVRSDLVIIGNNSPFFSSTNKGWWIFREGLVISSIVDIPLKEKKYFQIGLGIGLQI